MKPNFSFVIPVYNRQVNLDLVLYALTLQTVKGFEIIIADDGSDDKTRDAALKYQDRPPIKYYWHKHAGYRVSLNRNQGTRLRRKECTHIWYLDSDVLLNRKAVEHATKLCAQHPEAVICGRYDWLPAMHVTTNDVKDRWDELIHHRLQRVRTNYKPGIVGDDPRQAKGWTCPTILSNPRGIALSGNLIVPAMWFERSGGFDENIEGQGQDCEFSYTLAELGAKAIRCPHIIGYHLDHFRDTKWMTASVLDTIEYIHEKHGPPLPDKWYAEHGRKRK